MNSVLFQVVGQSMWPFLKSGEKVIVRQAAIKDLKIGDLILYRFNGQLICHRLVKKDISGKGRLLYLRGDLSWSAPEIISEDMILGRVCGIIRKNNIIDCCARYRRFINSVIVIIAPLIAGLTKYGRGYLKKIVAVPN